MSVRLSVLKTVRDVDQQDGRPSNVSLSMDGPARLQAVERIASDREALVAGFGCEVLRFSSFARISARAGLGYWPVAERTLLRS